MLPVIILLLLTFIIILVSVKMTMFKCKVFINLCMKKESKNSQENEDDYEFDNPNKANKRKNHFRLKALTVAKKIILSICLIIPEIIPCVLIFFIQRYSIMLMIAAAIFFVATEIQALLTAYNGYVKICLHPEKYKTKINYSGIKENTQFFFLLSLTAVSLITIIVGCNFYDQRETVESASYEVLDLYACEYDKTIGSFSEVDAASETTDEGTVLFITIENGDGRQVVMVNYEDVVFDLRADTMSLEERNIRSEKCYKVLKTSEFFTTGTRQEFVLHMRKDDLLSSYIK